MHARASHLALLLLLLPSTATHGHVGAEWQALDQERPGLVEAEFGLLVDRGDELRPWGWTCHEAITTPDALVTPLYASGRDDQDREVVLGAVPDQEQARDAGRPVYRSMDLCDWEPVTGLPDASIIDLLFVGPQVAIAAMTSGVGQSGVSFHVSTDSGASWSTADSDELGEERILLSLRADGAGGAWAASFLAEDSDSVIIHRTPDGQAWTSRPLDLQEAGVSLPEGTLVPSRMLAADGERAWLGIGDPRGHVVLATFDGGDTWQRVLTGTGAFLDGDASDDGIVWMLESTQAVWRSTDGRTFEALEDLPPAGGIAAGTDGGAILATSELRTGALTFALDAEGTATSALLPRDLSGPLDCPPQTHHTEVCAPLWFLTDTPQPVDPPPPPPEDEDDATGCGCSASTAPVASFTLLLALTGALAARRRRD